MALGGFDILLPKDEIDDAMLWMADIQPIEDYDPIPDHKKRDIIQASVLTLNPLFVCYLLPPVILLCLWMAYVVFLWFGEMGRPITLILANSSTLCIIGILAHARHIVGKNKGVPHDSP